MTELAPTGWWDPRATGQQPRLGCKIPRTISVNIWPANAATIMRGEGDELHHEDQDRHTGDKCGDGSLCRHRLEGERGIESDGGHLAVPLIDGDSASAVDLRPHPRLPPTTSGCSAAAAVGLGPGGHRDSSDR